MLQIDDLFVAYGTIEILHGVSLTVDAKEFVTVLGSNGAGKSTLLRALGGFVPVRMGRIVYNGIDLTRLQPHERVRRGLGIAMEGRRVFNRHTVRTNLELGGHIHRSNKRMLAEDMERVYELFPVLLRKSNHFANALSGGERQMLAIGQALMSRPSLLLLDEPSAGLSPRAVGQVFETLVEMRTTGVSALIVEQAVQQALEVSDRGYVLEAGRIVMHDRAQELRGNQEITDAYIGRLGKS